jgi:DNA-binding transcriptional MocR family regulator
MTGLDIAALSLYQYKVMIDLVQHLIKPGPAVKLASQIEALVRQGRIAPESLLPPVRDLARALRVSPGTAAAAYKSLRANGVVTTGGRRGTRVLPRAAQAEYAEPATPEGALDLQVADPDPGLLPDLQPFFARSARSEAYGGSHLDERLVRRMRTSFEADGVDGSNLLVTSGAISALYRALPACLSAGEKVAVEDPGFNEHRACVRAHAMIPLPVAVDAEGMLPAALAAALRAGARGIILTPRFQNPIGATLSRSRAGELRAVLAAHPDAAVLFDDYASLLSDAPWFHPLGKEPRRWLVVRSFNKVLAPDLRVAVAAADAETADRLRRQQWLADGWISGYLQRAAAAALASREVQSLLARARKTYAARREALLRALGGRGLEAHGATGLNVWVPVPDETAAVRGLLQRGWCVRAGARYRTRSAPAVRITIARLEVKEAGRLADDLCSVLGPGPGGRGP